MDERAHQLMRLAELMDVSAGVLRDLMEAGNFDGKSDNLDHIAGELERLSEEIRKIGVSELRL